MARDSTELLGSLSQQICERLNLLIMALGFICKLRQGKISRGEDHRSRGEHQIHRWQRARVESLGRGVRRPGE
jgi:hypothetical protein